MVKLMNAAVVRQFRAPLVIEEMEIPSPGSGQILVKYEATGVCHTDLHAANGDWPVKPSPPFIPGHEGAGFVAAVGAGVKRVKEGDRVGVPWLHAACGYCPHCRTGWETLCASQSNTGYSVNGTFAEFGLADPDFVGNLPNGLDFGPAAPVLCAGVTVYKGLKESEVRPGEWVAISGVGGLGHMAVQYAKAMGMNVVAADIFEDKLALAKQLGADITINAKAVDAVAQIQAATNGGVHGVLVTAVSPPAMEQAFGFMRSKGTMVLVGLPPGKIALPVFETVLKRITVRGSIVGTRQDLDESLQFAAEGKVTPHFSWDSLENINDIFHRMEAGKIDGRVVIPLS
ncbi:MULTISPECIES: alcohol dehydrogenase AdhP [unclassified Rhizobium]|uniref:alcohol dehydrogenase AdhP n=1 Tax=unclassified Rhizobium TaxID=2613769 RepID=UPI001A99D97B|nr:MULTISPECIES: alcohol dehydrogenase AdhP [unclassified Rhizobium]MBX5160242.1 alcohol dehydrogenase AdhP [Rhizobium sp. NZLR8]MBX5165481.1 alcohol dehydrogenase AdhP [Rhizobium sp. NZLR4b]MBX5197281.1 alcohol dehydrogenase AdhP [Rhizobium sp. NZLR10]MBX5203771.1 alcohol dehydrogenase AdhP [Rhizobium sp. NZLR1]MBX5209883.1 alcohol dehydrogenase AdhP [Rhizobium sp. NZLR11]